MNTQDLRKLLRQNDKGSWDYASKQWDFNIREEGHPCAHFVVDVFDGAKRNRHTFTSDEAHYDSHEFDDFEMALEFILTW